VAVPCNDGTGSFISQVLLYTKIEEEQSQLKGSGSKSFLGSYEGEEGSAKRAREGGGGLCLGKKAFPHHIAGLTFRRATFWPKICSLQINLSTTLRSLTLAANFQSRIVVGRSQSCEGVQSLQRLTKTRAKRDQGGLGHHHDLLTGPKTWMFSHVM
jgi:hypothetical protein